MKVNKVNGFRRVSKRAAERLYDNGEVIYLCPFRLRPGGPWHPEIAVTKTDLTQDCGTQYFISNTRDFEKVVSDYTYYNCSYSVGEYPAYYIKEQVQ